MQVFLSSIEVVLPLFIIMVIGWLAVRLGAVSKTAVEGLNSLIYWVLLPAMMFLTVLESTPITANEFWPAVYMSACVIIASVSLLIFMPRVIKDKKQCAAVVQATQRGNLTIYGVPFAMAVLGPAGLENLGVTLSMVVFVGNIIAALEVELYAKEKVHVGRVILGAFKSPIIIAVLAAFAVRGMGVTLPNILLSPLKSLSGATSAISFLALGGAFTMASTAAHKKQIILGSVIKLVLQPLIFVSIGVFALGLRGVMLVAMLCVFATPCPVSSVALTKAMKGDTQLAGELVAVTTMFSTLTLFGFVYAFKLLGYI